MTISKGAERARNAAGKRRKALERAVRKGCRDWRAGKPGDLIVGELEREFFAGGSVISCDHNADDAMTRPGEVIHDC